MNKLIYTSFSPNTRPKDLLLNLFLLLQPTSLFKGKATSQMERVFESRFGKGKAYTFNLARSGMYILFKSLNLPKESEVLIQGFTCSAAVNLAVWAGLKVRFVDIDKASGNLDLNDLKKKISKKSKVVMFQHTFGNSTGILEVKKFCEKNNLILVEDCTNTIFGKHKDKYIGTFGQAAIFSFGRDKAISGVNGGLIYINDDLISKSFEKNYSGLPYPNFSWTIKELLYPIFWFFIKALFLIKVGKLIHLVLTKLKLLTRATTPSERKLKRPSHIPALLPNSLARLALLQLEDIEELNSHRNKINAIYASNSDLNSFSSSKGNVLLRYPVLVDDAKELISSLQKNDIYLGDWYHDPITPLDVPLDSVNYEGGSCINSESVCKQIVNLPNHINMTEQDAKDVVRFVRAFYEN